MQTLKKGSCGEDVVTLQRKLNLVADGIFGPLTDEAVRAFQKAHGLTVDGIVGTKTWVALGQSPMPRRISKIILHCTATSEGRDYTVNQIRDWHLQRGFSNIGYHYVIGRDGTIYNGRPVEKVGAHTEGHNTDSIGIAYIGGCESDINNPDWAMKPKDTRTVEQKEALEWLIALLRSQYGNIPVYGHRDFANKACPSFDAKTEYKNL